MMRRAFQAVVLAGALVLTSGCALIDRAGAAVVVDGERYTEAQLGADFAAMDKALGSQQQPGTMDEVNRNFITIWVSDIVMQKAAEKNGLVADKAAVGKLRRALEKQLGGADKLEAYAATRGIAPNMIWMVLRDSVLGTDLGAKLVGGTDTDAQSAAASKYLADLAATLDIEVAPRFGQWDPKSLAAVELTDDLSQPAA